MTNFLQIKRTGRIEGLDNTTQYHPSWDDLKAPATAINPPGAASDPDRETTTGLLLFAANGTELVYLLLQMPHSWKEGSAISPHVHWTKTTSASGGVAWNLKYQILPIGAVGPGTWTDLGIVSSPVAGTPDNDTAWEHLLTSWGDIDMNDGVSNYSLSTCILFELSRIGANAADTYAADARLLEFDVHYQIDSLGSEEEFIK
jgi:hypothetical protein